MGNEARTCILQISVITVWVLNVVFLLILLVCCWSRKGKSNEYTINKEKNSNTTSEEFEFLPMSEEFQVQSHWKTDAPSPGDEYKLKFQKGSVTV